MVNAMCLQCFVTLAGLCKFLSTYQCPRPKVISYQMTYFQIGDSSADFDMMTK